MQEKFVDKDGNTVLAWQSSHPGLGLTPPPGLEAVPISEGEFKKERADNDKREKQYKPVDLASRVADLEAQVQVLKNKPSKP